MIFRKVRIAWSVLWGFAFVLVIALWVRSYSWMDAVPRLHIASANGELYARQHLQIQPSSTDQRFRYGVISMSLEGQKVVRVGPPGLVLPLSAIVVLLVGLSAAPHVRRFSLRTLLVATTLIGVVLGIIVWMSKAG